MAIAIDSVSRLLDVIQQWDKDLATRNHPHLRAWFRGHAVNGWKLEPGVYRDSFKELDEPQRLWKERHLTQDFRVFSSRLRKGNETDEEIYFLQQHYRMPTRLLDWTTNPLAALYFAVAEDKHRNEDGELIMMDAFQLATTQEVRKRFEGIATSRNKIFRRAVSIISNWREDETKLPDFILPVRPDQFDQRISRQQGYFTFHVPKCPDLTEKQNSSLLRVTVTQKLKGDIQTQLSLLGMHPFTAYGDLEGLSTWLKHSHRC